MKTLIAYATKYGATAKCAGMLADSLSGEAVLANIGEEPDTDIREYDLVLIGGPVYAGKLKKEVLAFCEANRDVLLKKSTGLFISCLYEGEKAKNELNESFPPWIIGHASAAEALGGEILLSKLNVIHRFITKTLLKLKEDVHKIDEDAIKRFAETAEGAAES